MKTTSAILFKVQNFTIKNIILLMLCIFAGTGAFANDLMVEGHGVAGAYTTITAALAAAANGDRILVYSSPGTAYTENVTVSKSVTIQSAYQGQRFVLHGSITFGNVNASLIGANVTPVAPSWAIVEVTGTITATIRIMNCIVNGPVTSNAPALFCLDHDTINAPAAHWGVSLYRGRVTGCVLNNVQWGIQVLKSSVATNDTVMIVGNIINMDHNTSTTTNGIYAGNTFQFLYIANNFITYNVTTDNPFPQGSAILIDSLKSAPNIYNAIINNTYLAKVQGVIAPNAGYELSGITYRQPAGLLDIENNLFYFAGNGAYAFQTQSGYAMSSTIIQYNFSNTGNVSGVTGTNYFNYGANMGIYSYGYPFVFNNAGTGNPDPAYYNTDLTINRPGVFGGSFNIYNFQGDYGINAAVLFMQAPRVVMSNQVFGISGDCLAR